MYVCMYVYMCVYVCVKKMELKTENARVKN